MLVGVPAAANLCDPAWLAAATREEVGELIRLGGADVEEECDANGNRPLHRALLMPGIDRDVLSALVYAGADVFAENRNGQSPADYSEARFERAARRFEVGSDAYARESSIRREVDRDFTATVDAHDKLCDPQWWRGSATFESMGALLRTRFVNPNHVCNPDRDRPLHLGLSPTLFPQLSSDVLGAVTQLLLDQANVSYVNRANRTALALATARYEAAVRQGAGEIDTYCRGGSGIVSLHVMMTARATGRSEAEVQWDRLVELCSDR